MKGQEVPPGPRTREAKADVQWAPADRAVLAVVPWGVPVLRVPVVLRPALVLADRREPVARAAPVVGQADRGAWALVCVPVVRAAPWAVHAWALACAVGLRLRTGHPRGPAVRSEVRRGPVSRPEVAPVGVPEDRAAVGEVAPAAVGAHAAGVRTVRSYRLKHPLRTRPRTPPYPRVRSSSNEARRHRNWLLV